LFGRWRRKGSQKITPGSRRLRSRNLHVESLENRTLLTASGASGFSQYDVNHDAFFNIQDVIKLVTYIDSNGLTTTAKASASSVSWPPATTNGLATTTGSSAPSATTASAMDVNKDGFVNVMDIVREVQAFDAAAPLMRYSLVATDASDQLISGPITV